MTSTPRRPGQAPAAPLVVDASVVLKWFVPEPGTNAARRILDGTYALLAPDLIFAELANAIWKRVRRGELTGAEARQLTADVPRIAVHTLPTRGLVEEAQALAVEAAITAYDGVYVSVAVRLKTRLVTADEKLVRRLSSHPVLKVHVQAL